MYTTKTKLKDLIYQVNGAAIEVHKFLGPGLLESIYHQCLIEELKLRQINYVSEFKIPLSYKGKNLSTDLRCDLLIENCLILELKAIETILPIHEAQLLTYMKLLNYPIGLMLNFNAQNIFLKGQKTYVNELYRNLKD